MFRRDETRGVRTRIFLEMRIRNGRRLSQTPIAPAPISRRLYQPPLYQKPLSS